LETPPPKDVKISRFRLRDEIIAARNTKKAEARIQSLPSLIVKLRKEMNALRAKKDLDPIRFNIVFKEWAAIIDFSTKLLEIRSKSIESGSDKSPISSFIISDGLGGPVYSLKKLLGEVEDFDSVPIVRVEGKPREIRTLPWREISTHAGLSTDPLPKPILHFSGLYNAIEEGILNLNHASSWLDQQQEKKRVEENRIQKRMGARSLAAADKPKAVPAWFQNKPKASTKPRRRIGSARRKTEKEIKTKAKKKAAEIVNRITNPDKRDR
jgi:hypothetical protein